jgi:hypothetical protein
MVNNRRLTPVIIISVIIFLLTMIIILIFSKYEISYVRIVARDIEEFTGVVQINNSCIFLEEKGTLYSLIWPKQFDIEIRDNNIYLTNYYLDPRTTWYFGNVVRIRGIKTNQIENSEVEEINTQCPSPYIVVNNWLL